MLKKEDFISHFDKIDEYSSAKRDVCKIYNHRALTALCAIEPAHTRHSKSKLFLCY